MVVLSRPRSSSGASAHKPAPKLSVPPPVNLPSLRKEHERLDPASSKPSAGHGGSGLGPGQSSSMSWIKPTLPVPEFRDKADGPRSLSIGEQRSFGGTSRPQGFAERAVILKGEDFPSLLATSNYSSKQKQNQVSENSEVWVEKAELSSALDMRPQLRSSSLTKGNAQCNEGGIRNVRNPTEQEDGNFPAPLPLVRLRYTSDWDDDERDRNHGFSGTDHYDGQVLLDGEARNSLSRDSGRGDPYGKDFMASKKEDHNTGSWRVTVQPNRELPASRLSHVDRNNVGPRNLAVNRGTGRESSHDRLPYGDRRDFSYGMGTRNSGVAEASNERVEVSSNWQRGKPFANGVISKGSMSSSIKRFSTNDHVQSFTKEKLTSNAGKSYAENSSWGGKDTFSSDAILDLNTKVFRKKKEVIKHTDLFDPVRESFEAELERVQRLQEQERQLVMEEQARILEFARRESEERERIFREEEERKCLLEEQAREAVWRAEQEKMEAVRRAEEQRIAREEERRKIHMEEERRKEAARQKLLELEAKIARRQTEAEANNRMKEMDSSRDSDLTEWEKNEIMVEHITSSPSFTSSSMNRLPEAGFKLHTSSVENCSSTQRVKPENSWSNNNNSIIKFQDQDSGYPSTREDAFCSNRSFHRKQSQGIQGPKPVTPSFKRGVPDDQTQKGQSWDRNRGCDQDNVRSNVDTVLGGWDHSHFDGNQLVSYSERSFQNNEMDDIASFSRVRHTVRQPRVPPPPSLSSSMRKNSFQAASGDLTSSFSVYTDARSNQTDRNEESDMQILYGCSYHQRITEPCTPELLKESASSLLQTEEKSSPRYDSQSSLSVSNPPSSPTQLSHDEFDDCGGSPALTSVEEENMTFSAVESMIPETELDTGKIDAEMIPLSHGEDDEWAVEDNEEMQEEEEEDHDDGPDSNHEDNKAPDSDTGELEMKNKLEDLVEVVEKPNEMCDTCGIDGCVQLGVSGGKTSTNQGLVSDSMSEHVFANANTGSLQSEETIYDKFMNASSGIAEITVEAQEDLFLGPVTNADQPADSIRAKISGQNPVSAVSRFPLPSSSSLCSISSSDPTSSGQDDVPAKLQFGLFSSPPLIPSPLPTIQIGSIQMPLPLNAHIDSYTHSHYPLFQFGQLRYTAPISQVALPTSTQTMPFVQPPIARQSPSRNLRSSSNIQVNEASTSADKGHHSFLADKQPVCASEITNPCQSILDYDQSTPLFDATKDEVLISHRPFTATASTASNEKKYLCKLISGSENPDTNSNKNFRTMVHTRRARGRPHFVDSYSSVQKSFTGQKAPGIMPEIKRNRLTYSFRNTGSLPSFVRTETSFVNSNRPHRRVRRHIQGTEYRVKESDGSRQIQCSENFYGSSHSLKPSFVGAALRNAGRKVPVTSKSSKLMNEEAALSGSQVVGANNNMSRDNKKETLSTSLVSSGSFQGCEVNLSKSVLLGDDIDTPLRSGIVRVFNQPGIEASSDGDGFVEVRSKRKISNERRGQRQRESNSKHKVMKAPRRHRANLSSNEIANKSDMFNTMAGISAVKIVHSDLAIAHRRSSSDLEATRLPITSIEVQKILPIGSPPINCTDYDTNSNRFKSSQTGSDVAIANDGVKLVPSLSFGNDIVAFDKGSVPLGNWGTVNLKSKAINSTHSQIDETLDPEDFSPVSVAKVSPDESKLATPCVAMENPSFLSEKPLNFPFDGEKIQFGAVASPSPLPSPGQSVSSGIWPPCPVMLNSSIIHNLPMNDHCQSNFFDKEKCPSESCTHLDDTEAEAEAAASAVAVAAITNDEITVSKLGTGSISGNGSKAQSGPGMTSCTDATGQAASEESLVVTLPADLSVDTTLSLWPPLPNLQSSRPMLSHIAGPQPSPFPFFDPSPMLSGPIFAFRPQDESIGTHSQKQQSANFVSGPTATWPQCHSGVDSFYGSPSGFPAPFISPSAGLSGVHSHPPMVFYNHFAPVGQFGQVGLSYMGNNYIPTGKQPDWKHNLEGATTVNLNKTDPGNLNVVYGQPNAAHIPTPIQHLSTGSSVMQATSPFTMFNLRPFQSSTDISVPAQWHPSIPHPSPHTIRLSTPLEQLQSLPLDASCAKVTLPEPHSAAADLPDELGLVESTASNSTNAQAIHPSRNHSTTSINKDQNGIPSTVIRLGEGIGIQNMPARKPQDFERTTSPVLQHLGPIGKVGSSLNSSSGGEWGRRSSFQGKHRNNNNNKNAGALKTKQIYVAKSLLTSSATSS